ncbi:MAG: cysteine hydrolase [Desulfobacterales bacterium]|nr:cysteine hydrolase [Desulfobacterales bacterium]
MTKIAAAADGSGGLTRNRPIHLDRTAMLIIDVQQHFVFPGQGGWAHIDPENIPADMRYYFDRVENHVLPNIGRLQRSFRQAGVEVLFTVIESLTRNGRERGLDYKISGFLVPKGSPGAKIPHDISPIGDEIVIAKGSSSVFNSTNIDYLLRNLEIDCLVTAGLLTDQCIESAVRDACDRGFLVTLVTDACATHSQERHDASLRSMKGYCRQVTTDELIAEVGQLRTAPRSMAP